MTSKHQAGAPTSGPSRRAGVLVHVTSLPGTPAIGDLGPASRRFIDWCGEARVGLWQLLPLGPVGAGDSPYAARSSFAGEASLISVADLSREAWCDAALPSPPACAPGRTDYEAARRFKRSALRRSWSGFRKNRLDPELRDAWDAFVAEPWLDDWALFEAASDERAGRPWYEWEPELRDAEPGALQRVRDRLADSIEFERYVQFVFARQWSRLRRRAADRGVAILGDLPFYVSWNSADAWTGRRLFKLDARGRPTRVAGVPPDYFSPTGQLWGNPVYAWNEHAAEGYCWWVDRISAQLRRFDMLRLDHFRAFESCWEVDADRDDAALGRWEPGPGEALFAALAGRVGGRSLPLVAEDLGEITDEVHALRQRLGLPGMRVMQFGFDEGEQVHLPENHPEDSVAYAGTHDNDTILGWVRSLDAPRLERVLARLGPAAEDVPDRMLQELLESRARIAVMTLQDLLRSGSEARMNVPSVAGGNWCWRAPDGTPDRETGARVRRWVERSGRAV